MSGGHGRAREIRHACTSYGGSGCNSVSASTIEEVEQRSRQRVIPLWSQQVLLLGGLTALSAAAETSVRSRLCFGLRVTPLGGGGVELFLYLLEPNPDALLVEIPDVAMERGVGLSQLIEVRVQVRDTIGDVAVQLARFVQSLVESFDPLFEGLPELLEASIGLLPGIVVHVDQQVVTLGHLSDQACEILAE